MQTEDRPWRLTLDWNAMLAPLRVRTGLYDPFPPLPGNPSSVDGRPLTSTAWAKAVVGGVGLVFLALVLAGIIARGSSGFHSPALIAPAVMGFLGVLLVQVGIFAFAVHLGTEGTRQRLDTLIARQRPKTKVPRPRAFVPAAATANTAQPEVVRPAQPQPLPAPRFDESLLHEAAINAGGWVYDLDPGLTNIAGGPTGPEGIRGAWKIGEDGNPTGEYAANPNYQA
jgi:hypothetical protein